MELETAIVGAGPYGLALAASLPEGSATVFGEAAGTWRAMQPDMELRARWLEMDLAYAGQPGSLAHWASSGGSSHREPMTVRDFLDYLEWFRATRVPSHVDEAVELVERQGQGFRISTAARSVTARSVAIAVGITPFASIPRVCRLSDDRIVTAAEIGDVERLSGLRIAVVGGGQSAIETAARAAAAGAEVTLLARSRIHWFAAREPSALRGRVAARVYSLAYPALGYGPPILNRLVLHPDLFRRAPRSVRRRLTARLLRPGASDWLRESLTAGGVVVREGCGVEELEPDAGGLGLRLSDHATLTVDRLIVATGYRFALERLAFLAPELRGTIGVDGGWPILDRWFRSTNRGISFLGYPAEGSFGPVARFVLGVPFTVARAAGSRRAG